MQKDSLPGRRGEIIFVLRTTGVSPPDRDKGRRPLTPGKMLPHFSVYNKPDAGGDPPGNYRSPTAVISGPPFSACLRRMSRLILPA